MVVTILVISLLGKEVFHFFQKVSIVEFFTSTKWTPLLHPRSFGVWPLVLGTLKIVVGSILVSLPLGILVAVFISEYAHRRIRTFLKPVLEILAGIPTVVYGYFALTFITPFLRKHFFPEMEVFNALSACIVVAIMIFPMICSLCDDAFKTFPRSLKEGAYALGGRSFEVVLFVLIPASFKRIGAATVLSISRAVGETMAVTLAAGATPGTDFSFLKSIQTMTAYIVQVSLGDVPQGGIEYLSCFVVGALLFVITFFMSIAGHLLIFDRAAR